MGIQRAVQLLQPARALNDNIPEFLKTSGMFFLRVAYLKSIYKQSGISHNSAMSKAKVLFHIAEQDGLEFVFTSGNALGYPLHTHISVYTITVVRKGTVLLNRNRSTDTYPEGSVYVVAPHEPHSPEYVDAFDIVSLCVKKNLFRRMPRSSLAALCMGHMNRLVEQHRMATDTAQRLITGIDSIYRDIAAQKMPAAPTMPAAPEALFDAPRRCSKFHFIRKFKNETGLTPHQYAVQNRIRKAKELLAADIPLADAAALAGFCDQSHLNRWFIRNIGITPRRYKNSCFFLNK